MYKAMELNRFLVLVLVIAIFVSVMPLCSAFTVTGKQITNIHPGKNVKIITVKNTCDSTLVVKLIPTADQYYTPENITFKLNENWQKRFNNSKDWQRVYWITAKYSEAIIAPHTSEDIKFTIDVPENITSGTFYAKVEIKDITEKQGLIVIRPIYVSQIAAQISSSGMQSGISVKLSYIFFFMVVFLFFILRQKIKKMVYEQ